MKKIFRIAAKTGVDNEDVKKIFGISLLGFIISFFSSCIKNGGSQNEIGVKNEKPSNLKELADSVKKSTSTSVTEDNKINDSCGPTPGYPCGTRYYTVSIKDFCDYDRGNNLREFFE